MRAQRTVGLRWPARGSGPQEPRLAPRPGFEPGTCRLGGGRAIQLCHRGLKAHNTALAWPTPQPPSEALVPAVGAHQAVHGEGVRFGPLQEIPHAKALGQVELRIQRQQPEEVVVRAVAFRRHRPTVAEFAEIVDALRVLVRGLGQTRGRTWNVVEHPMRVAVSARGHQGRVRVVAEDGEGFGVRWRVPPCQSRRDIRAFARVLCRDGAAGRESRARQLHSGKSETHVPNSMLPAVDGQAYNHGLALAKLRAPPTAA